MGSIIALSALSINVVADEGEEDPLAEAGLTLIALRNDTLDTNQDGETDAIRVVVVLNSDQESTNLELRLIGEYKDREVTEILQFTFSGQSNASLTYDAWASGEHELRLQIVDQDGNIISHHSSTNLCIKASITNSIDCSCFECPTTYRDRR